MKKTLLFIVLIIIIPLLNSTITPNNGGKKYVDGQVMVMLRSDLPQGKTQALTNILTDFSSVNMEMEQKLSDRMNIFLLKYNPSKITADKLLKDIKANPNVKLAQFNHFIEQRELIPNDIDFALQWNMNNTGQTGGTADADLDCPEAWEFANSSVTATGDTIIIAIVDDGFDLNHEDLSFWKNHLEIPGNGVDDDANGYIDDYDGWNSWTNSGVLDEKDHGTHVTGIAAARGNNGLGVTGVNLNVKVLPVVGSATVENIVVAAYAYVVEMRALYNETGGEKGAFIVSTNSSFGVNNGFEEDFPIWAAMYDSLGWQGILSAGATANANINIDVEGDVPTSFSSNFLITVTNTDDDDVKSSFAGYGLVTIDLGAPGTQVYSTRMGNNYGIKTGTSMASPHAAGAIAYMFSAATEEFMTAYHNDPAGMALVIKEYLLAGTDPLPSLAGITVTGGRINIYNAAMKMTNPEIVFNPLSLLKVMEPDLQDSISIAFTNNTGGPVSYSFGYPEPQSWTSLSGPLTGSLAASGSSSIMVHFNSIGINSDTLFSYLDFNYGDGRKSRIPVHLYVQSDVIPEVSVNITASLESVCAGETVDLNSEVTGGSGTYTYSWTSVPAGTVSSDTNITVSPAVPTTYYLQVSDISGKTGSDFFQVLIKPLPDKPIITSGPTSVDNYMNPVSNYTSSETSNADSYVWYITPTEAGTTTSTGKNAEINWTPGYTGSVEITVVGINDCGIGLFSEAYSVQIFSSESVDENDGAAQLVIYPVPANTVLSVKCLGFSSGKDYSIGVYNLSGILMADFVYPGKENEIKIDVSDFKSGVYNVVLKDDSQVVAIRKVLITH